MPMRTVKCTCCLVLSLLLFTISCSAQFTVGYQIDGNSAGDNFGYSVSNAGDVNGDAFGDFIVGAWLDDSGSALSGSATVYSGLDGSVLYTFHGGPGDQLGVSVGGGGDVNADGFDDLIVGAWGANPNGGDSGAVYVFSGADGSTLYTFAGDAPGDLFGFSSSAAGDINNDGFADIIGGSMSAATNGPNSGLARVFSGADGSVLYSVNGDAASDQFGWSVSGAGDLDSDGFHDFIVGAIGATGGLGADTGLARVYSGANGSILYSLAAPSAGSHFGFSVSSAGDVNCDGSDDFVVGSRWDGTTGPFAGAAFVYSGTDGSVLHTFLGDSTGDQFGTSVRAAGDVNGDGFADIIVGANADDNNGNESGLARVFSGFDGAILMDVSGDSGDDRFGKSVSGAGDVNFDGFDDVIVGARFDDNNGVNSGSATVFLAPTLPSLHYDFSFENVAMKLMWQPDGGVPTATIGTLICTGATPGGTGIYGVSLAPTAVLLFGYLPLLVATDPINIIDSNDFGYGALGELVVPNVTRQNAFLAGQFVYIQLFEMSPIIRASNGLRLTFN